MDNKKKEEYINQHFVPKVYLQNFTVDGNQIRVYDKNQGKEFVQSIKNIAYLKRFYDIPEKYIQQNFKNEINSKFYETEFFSQGIEPLFANLINLVHEKANEWILNENQNLILNEEDKCLLATLISVQYLRMPTIRNRYVDADKKIGEACLARIKGFVISQNPQFKEAGESLNISYDNEDRASIIHADIFADEELLTAITNLITSKHWVFYLTKDKDFFTSDNPIIIKPHLLNQPEYYEGFGMKGSEVIFPLGSSILLTLWDDNYFTDKMDLDNKFYWIDDKSKREYNCYQYIFANRQVYSENNYFELIKMLKASNNGEEIFIKPPTILVNGR